MIKIKYVIASVVALLSFSSCSKSNSNSENVISQEPTKQYSLNVIDPDNYIIDKPSEEYSYHDYNEVLKFHSEVLLERDLAMFVNGKFVTLQNEVIVDGHYIWEFEFTMPKTDTTVEFQVMVLSSE